MQDIQVILSMYLVYLLQNTTIINHLEYSFCISARSGKIYWHDQLTEKWDYCKKEIQCLWVVVNIILNLNSNLKYIKYSTNAMLLKKWQIYIRFYKYINH
jgi:hypothetical protein